MIIFDLARRVGAIPGTIGFAKRRRLGERRAALCTFLSEGRMEAFPQPIRPRCTIIIPTFNGAEHTLQCLLSLLPYAAEWLEILVYDDCGNDQTMELVARFKNVVAVRANQNGGFLKAVNAATKLARGKFIILMNNDAKLVEGSIAEALDLFERVKSCGYMGARVKFASGVLQEAGCIIYQNGTTNGYLRFAAADDPRAMFIRDVDYCSGVFCILRKDQFLAMGGFDLAYAPAYFEETDLCMRLREAGMRCIYNPSLLIEHFEFGSQPTSSARRNIAERRQIFLGRWGRILVKQGFPRFLFADSAEAAARRLQPHPRLLIVTHYDDLDYALIASHVAANGATTLHVLNCPASGRLILAKALTGAVELTFSRGGFGLQSMLRSRLHYFDSKIALGPRAIRTVKFNQQSKTSTVGKGPTHSI